MSKKLQLSQSEVDSQSYRDCKLSSGLVWGHPHDDIYLKFERDGEEPTTIYLRQDEAARICALLANAVWSAEMFRHQLKSRRRGRSR